ncbi:MAG: site-specific integrase [Candidatus Acidiferrales bacterium]
MTRRTYQQGYVSAPIHTRRGTAFKIRYRVRTLDGRWKQKSETLYGLPGRRAARSALGQRIQTASTAVPGIAGLTIREFTESYWKPYLDRRCVKPSTMASYNSALELHILPAFGDCQMSEVVPLHVEQFLQTKLKAGLSPKTTRNLLGVLQGLFSLAVDNDLLTRSPIRNRHKPTVRRIEKPIWSPIQMRDILENTPDKYRVVFQVLALTGARTGEVLGLQWKHVDLEKAQLRIEQSFWRGLLVAPKTKDSVRTINMSEVLVEALRRHREASDIKGSNDFVFCKRDGSPLHPDVLRKDVLYPVLDRLRISRPSRTSGFHAFRHSVGSLINAETGNLKLAQKLLGHSNINMTADVYTHTSQESEREAARVVERAIYGDLFPVCSSIENGNKTAAVN